VWQYSSTGKVSGISGNVDMNEAYKDYPQIIKAAGLNGFQKTEPEPAPEPVPEKKTIKTSVTIDGKTYTGTLTEE
jgi:GH25 family lysozyme M1 (1,4-beta-N-acetylmuramidase)